MADYGVTLKGISKSGTTRKAKRIIAILKMEFEKARRFRVAN